MFSPRASSFGRKCDAEQLLQYARPNQSTHENSSKAVSKGVVFVLDSKSLSSLRDFEIWSGSNFYFPGRNNIRTFLLFLKSRYVLKISGVETLLKSPPYSSQILRAIPLSSEGVKREWFLLLGSDSAFQWGSESNFYSSGVIPLSSEGVKKE